MVAAGRVPYTSLAAAAPVAVDALAPLLMLDLGVLGRPDPLLLLLLLLRILPRLLKLRLRPRLRLWLRDLYLRLRALPPSAPCSWCVDGAPAEPLLGSCSLDRLPPLVLCDSPLTGCGAYGVEVGGGTPRACHHPELHVRSSSEGAGVPQQQSTPGDTYSCCWWARHGSLPRQPWTPTSMRITAFHAVQVPGLHTSLVTTVVPVLSDSAHQVVTVRATGSTRNREGRASRKSTVP